MNEFDQGFITRILVTLIFLLSIPKNVNLFLPLSLIILDGIDSYYVRNVKNNYRTFAYKIRDKIADSISYLFVFMLFPVGIEFLWVIMYRILGVILFGLTRQYQWLVIAPDLAKELLAYKVIYKQDLSVFPFVVGLKVVYEIHHHTIVDPLVD